MGKLIATFKTTPTLNLSEQTDGYWLWDTTRNMNLSMRAKTPEAAFIEALMYYQTRCLVVEKQLKQITERVDNFVESIEAM
jgi:hypothetical protein